MLDLLAGRSQKRRELYINGGLAQNALLLFRVSVRLLYSYFKYSYLAKIELLEHDMYLLTLGTMRLL